MSTPRQVTLMGREFRIKTDEDANHVQAVADYVNAKIDELSAGNANAASQHLLLMTSLSLADELFKIREEHARLTAKIRASSQTLLSRLGGMTADKRALRRAARAARAALSPATRAAASERMATALDDLLGDVAAVGVYAAVGDEADPAAFVARLLARGARVAYPRLDPPGFAFVAAPGALVPGPRGLPVPPPGAEVAPLAALAALVVPGLAFDAAGGRLGQGGGFYDRLLGGLATRPRLVGLAFAAQVVPAVPREAHDVLMDTVVTEGGPLAQEPGGGS